MNCGSRLKEQNILRKDVSMEDIITFFGYCDACVGHFESKEVPLKCTSCSILYWIEAPEEELQVMKQLMMNTETDWIPVDGHKGCSCSKTEHSEPISTESLEPEKDKPN